MLRGETFPGSFPKSGAVPKVAKVTEQKKGVAGENKIMRDVRARDRFCRFPDCHCKDFRLVLDCAHLEHRGMGGNPKRDRTTPPKLLLLCRARHRGNRISLDKGTVRIRPLTRAGAAGPCAFDVDKRELLALHAAKAPLWMELGRETARHVFAPFTDAQLAALEQLRGMAL